MGAAVGYGVANGCANATAVVERKILCQMS
jgi:hypothetical protein